MLVTFGGSQPAQLTTDSSARGSDLTWRHVMNAPVLSRPLSSSRSHSRRCSSRNPAAPQRALQEAMTGILPERLGSSIAAARPSFIHHHEVTSGEGVAVVPIRI
jgi:hypothetical protein